MSDRPPVPNPSSTVAVEVPGGSVPVVVRRQGDASGPALVIVPSIFGIGDDLIGQMEELAPHAGFVAAMDLFWRVEAGPVPYHDMETVMARVQALDRERAYLDFTAVVRWAREAQGGDGSVIGLGICFGGPFCLIGAADGLLQGIVTWHGTRMEAFVERASEMRCPMALHFGDNDRVVPMSAVEAVRDTFAGRADVDVFVHPGADHGFSHPAGPTFDPKATAAAVASVKRLLAQVS